MSLATDAARWRRRLAAHECGRCGSKLPEGWTRKNCESCRAHVAEGMRKHWWRKRGIVPPPKGRRPTIGERVKAAQFAVGWQP